MAESDLRPSVSGERVDGGPAAGIGDDRIKRVIRAVAQAVARDPVLAPYSDRAPDWTAQVLNAVAAPASAGPRSPLAVPPTLIDMVRRHLLADWAEHGGSDAPEFLTVLYRLEEFHREPTPPDGADPAAVEFVAGVAHDLRSPLTSILFLAETLQAGVSGEVNTVQRRQLGIIYSAALGLVTVASDIIEFARGSSGLTEREPTSFSVTEIMRSVHDIVRPLAEEKGLSVHLFPPKHDLRLGHPLALSRVLLNLTTNGLKFTDDGFVEIAVREVGTETVEFAVRDTGRGITPDRVEAIYHPFRRSADGKKYGFSGSGLGLSISRRLVEAMGSELQFESRPTWGTRFWFALELPIEPPQSG